MSNSNSNWKRFGGFMLLGFFTYVPMQTTVILLILLTFDNQFISVLKETAVIMNT